VASSLAGLTKFLDDLSRNLGPPLGDLSGLRSLVDEMAHWALANVGSSEKSAAEQHLITGLLCAAVQRFLIFAASQWIGGQDMKPWLEFSSSSPQTWFYSSFVDNYRAILLVPRGLKFNPTSLQSVLVAIGLVCPDCRMAGFLPSFCPTKACWDRQMDSWNSCFSSQLKKWCISMDSSDHLFPSFSISGSRTRPRLNVHTHRALSTQWLSSILRGGLLFSYSKCH
jgi:hypothetical protein